MTTECTHGNDVICMHKLAKAAEKQGVKWDATPDPNVQGHEWTLAVNVASKISGLTVSEITSLFERVNAASVLGENYTSTREELIALGVFKSEMQTPYIERGRCRLCKIPVKAGAVHFNCPEDKRGK